MLYILGADIVMEIIKLIDEIRKYENNKTREGQ